MSRPKIYSVGENAVTVSFEEQISPEINSQVLQLDDYFKKNSFDGFIEAIPAYSSLTIIFDVVTVRKSFSEFETAFDAVKNKIETALLKKEKFSKRNKSIIEIPVNFADEFAIDLDFIYRSKNISKEVFIETFTSKIYRVYMIGFLPGFGYMGEVDERIAVARKETPRLKVPKGSVGIAGRQTGIYPSESPGGWQIVGRTDIELFTPQLSQPTLLNVGDSVKFYPV